MNFPDDASVSEGAVDLGGPMSEFFTLTCVDNDDHFSAGVMLPISIVQGGPGPQFLSPAMFEALFTNLHKIVVPLEDVYDHELQASCKPS